jgi:hypothetical protein
VRRGFSNVEIKIDPHHAQLPPALLIARFLDGN